MSTRTLTGMLPSEVVNELGMTSELVTGLVTAERYGIATVVNATIIRDGYQSGATQFNAATATYTVRY